MKTFYLGLVLTLSLLQAGCGIGGYSMTGMVLVDNAKPRLQYYEKQGWTSETRRQDSAECGAIGNDDRADIATARIKADQRTEETERQTEMRLRKAWHVCMTEKGYRDTRAVTQ